MVALEVEALAARGRDPRRLLGGEVDDAEVGDVLVRLVELDAERVGVRVGEVGAGADVLKLAAKRDLAVVGPDHGRRLGRGRRRGQQRADEPHSAQPLSTFPTRRADRSAGPRPTRRVPGAGGWCERLGV